MAPQRGFEPLTYPLGGDRSIQLSYRGLCRLNYIPIVVIKSIVYFLCSVFWAAIVYTAALVGVAESKRMSEKILVGVDGGGTKTKVRIETAGGKLIGTARGGPAQIRYSIPEAWDSVMTTLDEALSGSGVSYEDPAYDFYVSMGLAGCEVVEAKQQFLAFKHPFKTLSLHSDAYTACLGAHGGVGGGVLIMGTGVHAMALVGDAQHRVSGWGFPHDDLGGGAWLGIAAVRHSFAVYDGRERASSLSRQVLAQFENEQELVAWATASDARSFATLAPMVMACAREEDYAAHDIVTRAARYLDRVIATLVQKSGCKDLKISCFGGMAAPMKDYFTHHTLRHLVDPVGTAVTGALGLARQDMLSYSGADA